MSRPLDATSTTASSAALPHSSFSLVSPCSMKRSIYVCRPRPTLYVFFVSLPVGEVCVSVTTAGTSVGSYAAYSNSSLSYCCTDRRARRGISPSTTSPFLFTYFMPTQGLLSPPFSRSIHIASDFRPSLSATSCTVCLPAASVLAAIVNASRVVPALLTSLVVGTPLPSTYIDTVLLPEPVRVNGMLIVSPSS